MALNVHVATQAHTGGGAEEEIVTANYGPYVVPQGMGGMYLLGLLAVVTTPALGSYARIVAREWDGEDIFTIFKAPTLVDPSDYQWLSKPRYCPAGSIIHIFGLHGANEAMHVILVFRSAGPMQTRAGFNGESVVVRTGQVANSAANAWTVSRAFVFPSTKGPFLITGGICGNAGMIAGRLIIPNQPNANRPLIPAYRAPVAGIEGPMIGKLLEPVVIHNGETVTIEVLSTAAALVEAYLEYIPTFKREAVPAGSIAEGAVVGDGPHYAISSLSMLGGSLLFGGR